MVDDDDAVFKALGDRTRRRMLDLLMDRPGLSVQELAGEFEMSRVGAMKHLRVLERANLVRSERDHEDARCRRLYLNAVPIQRLHERWTTKFSAHVSEQLLALRRATQRGKKRSNQ